MSIQRNTTYNLLGSLIPLVVYILTLPMYLDSIGEIRYGIMTIIWLMLGYVGFFDLGLGVAVSQRMALLGKRNLEESANVFWTALIVNIIIGITIAIILWPIALYFIANGSIIQNEIKREIINSIPWVISALPIATLMSVMSGALQGREKFLELNIINTIGTILSQVMPLFAIKIWSENLNVLILSALFARIISIIIIFMICKKNILQDQKIKFSKEHLRSLLKFGGWATVTSFISPMIVVIDRMIIGAMSGAKSLTYYTVPLQLTEKITLIPNAFAIALFPRMSMMSDNETNTLACQGIRGLAIIMTPLAAVGIILMRPVLTFWINNDFAVASTAVGQVILIGFWANGMARVPYFKLMSKARPDLIAKCHLIQVIPYFILLYMLLNVLGLIGGAITFAIRALIDYIMLAKLAEVLKDSISTLCTQTIMLIGAILLSQIANQYELGWFVLFIVYIPIIFLWAWIQMPNQMKDIFNQTRKTMMKKMKDAK